MKPKRNPNDRSLAKAALDKNPFRTARGSGVRTAGQRENDLVFIADLYAKGYSVPEITEKLDAVRPYQVTSSMVYNDVTKIHARWINSYLVNFDDAKAKELAHIDALEKEYWEAWKNSLKPAEIVDSEKVDDSQGNLRGVSVPTYSRTKVRKRKKDSYGEPDFLTGIQWCIEQRCKIMGLMIYTQNINVSWRKQAEEQGIDPDGVVDELVKQFVSAAASSGPLDGTGPARSVGESQ